MGNSVPTKVLVLTVGVGSDVVRPLRLALEYYNPRFVLFLCTPQSRPHVDALLSQHPPVPDDHVEAFTETADAEKLALLCGDVIRSQLSRKRGLRPEQVHVDYTRATKAMSAAADYVAIDLKLAGVSYITGDTDERGQVITGTERLLSFRPLDLIFRRSWRALADLFNRGHFAGVIARVTALRPRTVREDHRRRVDFLGELSRACAAWEVLDYDGACRYFPEVLREFGDVVERLDLRLELLPGPGDPLGEHFAELYWTPDSTLRGYLEARDMSPLAHGFQPVGADVYGKLRALLTREFLPQVVVDWESWLPRCQLPRLPEEA